MERKFKLSGTCEALSDGSKRVAAGADLGSRPAEVLFSKVGARLLLEAMFGVVPARLQVHYPQGHA
jgi:hypothetical protein